MTRTMVITGVTRGLGRALALAAARSGQQVIGCGRDVRALGELGPLLSGRGDLERVDVADFAAVAAWAGRVLERHGPPDLLVNNAALINRSAALIEVPAEEFSALIDVNVKGVFHCIRAFLPAMQGKGAGVIVNLSSGWGRSTSPGVAPYCASKFAIEGLTRALAQELPRGLAAVALNPGVIDTDMLRSCFGAGAAAYEDAGRWAARALPFLLGLGAGHNGRSLDLPGGAAA